MLIKSLLNSITATYISHYKGKIMIGQAAVRQQWGDEAINANIVCMVCNMIKILYKVYP